MQFHQRIAYIFWVLFPCFAYAVPDAPLTSLNEKPSAVSPLSNSTGEHLEGVIKEKNGDIKFKAEKAFFTDNEKVRFEKKVDIRTEEGLSLQTDALEWDKSKGTAESDDKVMLKKADTFDAEGTGLKVDTQSKQAVLEKKVTVKIPQEGAGFIFVTCDGPLEMDYSQSEATFNNNVEMSDSETKLHADMAKVYFDQTAKTIVKVVAEGNVRVIRGKNTSYSQKATYLQTTKKIILEGAPRLILFPEQN